MVRKAACPLFLAMVSFSVGSEVVFCLAGPLDVEAGVTYTPFPFTRLETTADLALLMGPVSLRAGMRGAWFSAQGNGPGGMSDLGYVGPHFGLGLHL